MNDLRKSEPTKSEPKAGNAIGLRPAIEFRQTNEADMAELYRLFGSEVYFEDGIQRQQFENLYRWQYFNSPGKISYQLTAQKNSKLIAHYALISWPYMISGQKVVAGFGSNLIIEASERGGLLFFDLQKRYLGEPMRRGISFVYGLVNRPLVLQAHLKTGYRLVGNLPVYVRPMKVSNLIQSKWGATSATLLKPLSVLANLVLQKSWKIKTPMTTEEISSFPIQWDEVIAKMQSAYAKHAIRTAETLNWRFFGTKERTYRAFSLKKGGAFAGYFVTRKMKIRGFDTLVLVDFVLASTQDFSSIVSAVHRQALEDGVELISTMISPVKHYSSTLKWFGFLKAPEDFALVVNDKWIDGKTADLSSWFMTFYDHDVV